MEKNLFLIDGTALVYRSHFAFIRTPRINSKGFNTGAVLGFTNTLQEIITKEKPTHIAIAFDKSRTTFRTDIFPSYKGHREKTPVEIKDAFHYINKIVEGFNIKSYMIPNFEADDVIGTIAKKAEKEGFKVTMFTPDKDYAQLVSDNITLYRPARSGNYPEILGVEGVLKKFSIKRVEQVIDTLALVGDAVDNIPGCPSIGEKTAITLLEKYDSVEGIYDNINLIKGKRKEVLLENKEQVYMSKFLATIVDDMDIDFVEDEYLMPSIDVDKLTEVFNELEFAQLSKKILGKEIEAIKTESDFEIKNTIKCISNDELYDKLKATDRFYFDIINDGITASDYDLIGLVFKFDKDNSYLIDTNDVDFFKEFFENESISKVTYNLKKNSIILKQFNIEIKGKIFDSYLAHYLIQPELKHDYVYIAKQILNLDIDSTEKVLGKGKKAVSFADLSEQDFLNYCNTTIEVVEMTFKSLLNELKSKCMLDVFNKIEIPLAIVLGEMENTGARIDEKFFEEYEIELQGILNQLESDIFELSGEDFSINSPKQLGEVLFLNMGIPYKGKKTKKGAFSTSEDILSQYIEDYPIVEKVLEYKSINKLLGTYVKALPKCVSEETNRIHTVFDHVATGRLSSSNPNLQNIPNRTLLGRKIRKGFIPSDGNIMLAADYSQVELRLLAHMSNDENLIQLFKDGKDVHRATASYVNNVALEDVSTEMRSNAKSANFGIIYGIGATSLAKDTGMDKKLAKQFIDNYHINHPSVKQYINNTIAHAKDYGYVVTEFGRKRYIDAINSNSGLQRSLAEKTAQNAPIQGTAADIIKMAMVNIQNKFKELRLESKMFLQVHDELVFDVVPSELEVVKTIVVDTMENVASLKVPLKVDYNTGNNWFESH